VGYQANYQSRTFSRGTKALALARRKDVAGNAWCTCGTQLTRANTEYDHIIPWAIKPHSGPSNCQAMCSDCHAEKFPGDIKVIAKAKRLARRRKFRHPMPCGRDSRWSKPIGAFRPVRRTSQAQKLNAALERRYAAFINDEVQS
jgi:hypothetical protein